MDGDEIILNVSQELASMSLGFSIDAGGSVTKIVYRSKEDYENGKLKCGECLSPGKLRLRYFQNHDASRVIKFIQENCDIRESCREDFVAEGDSGDPHLYWYNTGVGYQHYRKQMDQDIQIRTKILSENDAFRLAISGIYTRGNLEGIFQPPLPLSPEAMDRALVTDRVALQTIQSYKDAGDQSIGATFDAAAAGGEDLERYARQISTLGGAELARELSLTEILYPCVFVTIGSTFILNIQIMEDQKPLPFGEYSSISGKTFLSLGMALTGAKSFKELVEMAERGDSRKVDTLAGDIKNRDRTDVDWYSMMMFEEFPIFSLGKLSEEEYKESYSKDDIAAGLLLMFSGMLSRLAIVHARIHHAKCVIFTGSYVSHHVTKESLEESFLAASLVLPFIGGQQLKMGILPNPGHIAALGTWQKNFELDQERQKNKK